MLPRRQELTCSTSPNQLADTLPIKNAGAPPLRCKKLTYAWSSEPSDPLKRRYKSIPAVSTGTIAIVTPGTGLPALLRAVTRKGLSKGLSSKESDRHVTLIADGESTMSRKAHWLVRGLESGGTALSTFVTVIGTVASDATPST